MNVCVQDNEAEWDQATEARSARLRALDTRDAVDEQLKRITDKSNSTVLFESPFLSPPVGHTNLFYDIHQSLII
jgi:hypothetical protein